MMVVYGIYITKHTALPWKATVTAHLKSKQLLLFVFAQKYIYIEETENHIIHL